MIRCYHSLSWSVVILVAALLPTTQGAERVDLLVRGGTVVTVDGGFRVVDDGAVAVRDGRIVAVGAETELAGRYAAAETLEARGGAVLPGLVNAHTHIPMVLFRGLADDLLLMDWLRKYIFPAEAQVVDEAFVRCGTRLGCLEMIRGGTTTYVDMYYFEDAVAEETSRAGMRAVLGQTVIDFPAPDFKTWPEAMAGMEKFAERWKGRALITPAIAPHAPYTLSTEHLRQARQFANRTGLPLVIHVAESQAEVETIREKHGASPVEYLERIGLLDGPTIAAHVVWPAEEDFATLARRRVGVAHCPQSNMKLASGVAPLPKLLAAGVAVGLGTDGAGSNNDLDLWEEIDTAAKLHKVFTGDARTISARQALELATIGGARAIHLDREIGSLEVGKRADLIVVGLDAPHQTPLYNVASQLAYATKAADVQAVVIDGRIVMRDRRVLTLDAAAVRAEATVYRDRVLRALEGRGAKP